MSDSVLDRLLIALDEAASSDRNVFVAPVAVFWPDKGRQWEGAINRLRDQRRIVRLGAYSPEQGSGPALWLRCVVAGTVKVDGPDGLPIVYLPGVSRDDLRSASSGDQVLAPLVPLQHLSQWFTANRGKDWTVRGLLTDAERGLGLNIARDNATESALAAGLEHLVNEPFARLEDRHIDAAFVNGLMNPDPVRLLLRWIDDPTSARDELGEPAWSAFVAQCKTDYGFDPAAAGVIDATRRLGARDGVWRQVWQRFRESPTEYPGIPERLRDARPEELFTASSLSWPQDSEAAEDQLRARLLDMSVLTPDGARKEIALLDTEYRPWRGSVWAQLGLSPLALAVEHLADVARRCASWQAGDGLDGMVHRYSVDGWKIDLAALRALGDVDRDSDVRAVAAASDALYRPWLDDCAKALQAAVGPEANSSNYAASEAPVMAAGQVVLFVDGLRLDIAHLLMEHLDGSGATVDLSVGLAALPTVTHTAKPVVVPIDHALLGPGVALDACRASSGASAAVQVLRSLLKDAGIQALGPQETGDPSGKAWTEAGEVDHKGHDLGVRLAHEIDDEVSRIARRIRQLLETGWSTVTVVTDHGWVLLPSGLPKNEGLPIAATVAKKGRCARLKDGATVDLPTVPWHWDTDVRIAIAPGISCFEANKTYEHGGVSPQECVVPRLTVRAAAAVAPSRAEIRNIRWRGLTLVVEFADLPDGAQVDLRRQAGAPESSIAALARLTGGTGKVILLVEDEDLEGEHAQLVVADSDGTILSQRETTVGQNK